MKEHTIKPEVGMLAWHKDGLDPREVTRVENLGGQTFIGLDILGLDYFPFPAENYTFTVVL